MGVTSPERHREVAVTPLQSDLARATPRCRSRFHRSEARERPYSDVPQRHHKVTPAGSDVTGATQPSSSRRATRSDVSQRPLQVAPEAWSDLSKRLLEVAARLLFARLHVYSRAFCSFHYAHFYFINLSLSIFCKRGEADLSFIKRNHQNLLES
ncbi:hypothetical protein DY000_02032608 [Brassica cretica]|uniref:Uncharacterized protein n=1 Tax=Brassica cretica TaxID=69181 RepID=A0ABQ7DSI4_BRACR|nr:hypothetical protein DY000_02032608 [Brassica cretica]